jgi:hypothetical protein
VTKLLEQIEILTEQERALIAAELGLGAPDDSEQVESAWKQELARRLEDLGSGAMQIEDTPTMIAELRAKFARR